MVLTMKEEEEFVAYLFRMAELGHPLSWGQLRLMVTIITQDRETPFTRGILGGS